MAFDERDAVPGRGDCLGRCEACDTAADDGRVDRDCRPHHAINDIANVVQASSARAGRAHQADVDRISQM